MLKTSSKSEVFLWEGLTPQKTKVQGEFNATNAAIVQRELKKRGIDVVKINKKKRATFFSFQKKTKRSDLIFFIHYLSTLLAAGLPIIQAFEIIASSQKKESMRQLVLQIKTDVSNGNKLSDALRKHPQYFDDLLCNLIASAEKSGTLDTMLKQIANYADKSRTLRNKIKKALFYPISIIVVILLVSLILFIFIVPQFAKIFASSNVTLPLMTRIFINISNFITHYYFILLFMIIGSIVGFIQLKKRSMRFQELFTKLMLKTKIIGPILEKVVLARVTRTFAVMLKAGIPVVDALQSIAGVSGNSIYSKAILKVKAEVARGQNIHIALSNAQLFPDMMIQMIAVGEISGSIDDMLDKLSIHYEEEVDLALNNLSNLLEPIIMVVLGIIVGSFVVAMYMPIFKLGSVV